MNEKTLLRMCVCVAILGIFVLLFVSPIDSTQTYARLVWVNDTTGLVSYEQTIWVESQTPILLGVNQCVRITGIYSQERITHAMIGPASDEYCGF